MTLIYQVITTAMISFTCLNLGILFAYPSSTMKLFSSENTTLDRVMTETELSLYGSMSSASTLLITPFCGYLLDTLGRKRTLILFFVPQLLCWVVLVTILRVEAVIFAMGLCGAGASILPVSFVYINEYCNLSIKGGMITSPVIFNGIGVLISYLLGGLLEYSTMNYTGLIISLVSFVLACSLKESPLYLMKKGFEKEATQAIAFFKGTKSNSEEVFDEMENIRRILNADIELRISPEEEKLNSIDNRPKAKFPQIRTYLIKSPSSRRTLITLVVIYTLCIFQGIIVVQIFAGPLFEAAVPSITATLSTAIFAIITVLGSCFGGYLSDKAGRRMLLITASFATGLFCVILATIFQFNWGPNWLIVMLIYIYTFVNILGAGTVPYVLLGEVFLPEIKGFATMACTEWCFICNFAVCYMFIPLFKAYGLGPLFYLFGTCSFFTAVFTFIYLPETKNLPVDIIQQKFLKKKY